MIKFQVKLNGRAIKLTLEEEFDVALKEIAKLEELTLQELCELIYRTSADPEDFPRAIRSFVFTYYRNLALVLPEEYVYSLKKKLNG